MYKVIGSDQKIYGPVSAAQIRQWAAEGRVNNATLLQAEGAAEWRPLSSFPEFGVPPVVPPVVNMPPRSAGPCSSSSGVAQAGLIFGVLSVVCCGCGFFLAIPGIICSAIALTRADAQIDSSGKSMALIGLILSILGLTMHGILPFFIGGFPPHLWWMHRHWQNL